MEDPDFPQRDLMDKVDVNLNVLRSSMMNWVSGHIDSTNIVTKDNRSLLERKMKFLKKLAQPTTLSHNMSNCPVLCLSTRTRNCVLPLGFPRHQGVAKIDTITRSRTPRIRATSPVGIRIGYEGVNRTCTNMKDERQRALNIAQDALDECKMWLPRIMHEQTNLLNSISKIRTGQCEILLRY